MVFSSLPESVITAATAVYLNLCHYCSTTAVGSLLKSAQHAWRSDTQTAAHVSLNAFVFSLNDILIHCALYTCSVLPHVHSGPAQSPTPKTPLLYLAPASPKGATKLVRARANAPVLLRSQLLLHCVPVHTSISRSSSSGSSSTVLCLSPT
jgi:hypothetical protein